MFNIFQTAYAVADIDAALPHFAAWFDIPHFQVNRDVPIETAAGTAYCNFALAFLGKTQIELIQPAGGADAVYRAALVQGNIRLHHIGCLIRDRAIWEATLIKINSHGHPAPVQGSFGGMMDYVYVDRRADLGHYLEYMHQTEAGEHLFDNVPRYAGPF